jgi:hypothetical protein
MVARACEERVSAKGKEIETLVDDRSTALDVKKSIILGIPNLTRKQAQCVSSQVNVV